MHKSTLQPYFEYNVLSFIAHSHFKKDIIKLEKIKKRTTKTIKRYGVAYM